MKGYLLDTHIFLWLTMTPERLSPAALKVIGTLETPLFVSAASMWEIAQKRAAKKLEFAGEIVVAMERHALAELPIRGAHCEAAAVLPWHHRDPFDRLLIAQAEIESLVLISSDRIMASYDIALLRG